MRIGLNGYFQRHLTTGSGQYLKQLRQALADLGNGNEYWLLAPDKMSVGANLGGGCQTISLATPFAGRNRHLDKIWFEQITLPRLANAQGLDLLHYPYFAAPLRPNLPTVVTVHDLIPMLMKPYQGGKLAQLYTRLVATTSRQATAIIADSECSKRDIVRLLQVPADKVSVIYLAASERFRPLADNAQISAKRAQYDLPGPFVLYLGGIDCRKNVPRLLQAFAELLRRGQERTGFPPDLRLALAGSIPEPTALFSDVRGEISRLGLGERVKLLGRVHDEDAPWLYNACEAFVFPSLYEGFGLPPLEAMACGAPVICSDSSSLPEVVGDAALTVNPEDIAAMAEAMERVVSDEGLRVDMRERGLRRAAQFSWHRTAVETLRVYQRAVVGSE